MHHPPNRRVRYSVDVDEDLASELTLLRERSPFRPSKNELVRALLRRGIESLESEHDSSVDVRPAVRS